MLALAVADRGGTKRGGFIGTDIPSRGRFEIGGAEMEPLHRRHRGDIVEGSCAGEEIIARESEELDLLPIDPDTENALLAPYGHIQLRAPNHDHEVLILCRASIFGRLDRAEQHDIRAGEV